MRRKARDQLKALEAAPLEQLQTQFPGLWQVTGRDLVNALETGGPEGLANWVRREEESAAKVLADPRADRGQGLSAVNAVARARMAKLGAQDAARAAAARLAAGGAQRMRLGWWSGRLIQGLLFARGLQRKRVSLLAFRWLWPLCWQRRRLLPLVQPQGIYCFYSNTLLQALNTLIDGRPAVEIAAGDGTLTRFLRAVGVNIVATDNQSWRHAISYSDEVELLDAKEAIHRHRAPVVLCSFPPPHNDFEKVVLASPWVELYVVLTTRHRFAAGDWSAYQSQTDFACEDNHALARALLPPEIDPAVLIFRRRLAKGCR